MADSQSEIKLVITGQHDSAVTSLEEVSKLITDVQESVAKLITRLGEAATTFADFGRGIADVAESVSTMSRRMTSFGKNMDSQAKAVAEGSDSIVKSMGEINQAVERTAATDTSLLKDFADAQNAVAMASYEAAQKITAETAAVKANADATKATTAASRQARHDQMLGLIGLQIVGDKMTEVGTKGLDMFGGAINSAIDFQASMDRVKAALLSTGGASQDNINKLGQVAQKLDQTTIFSANDITDALQALAKQGITFGDLYGDGIHNAIAATTTLAQATDTDLNSTATVIGDVMNEFNLKGTQMTSVVNSISGSMHVSKISMDDFYNAMKYTGPAAHNLGMNVNDVSQAIGLLAERGIKGTQAGTTLRRMFMNLEPHTKAATEEFQKLGLITKDGSNQFFDASGHIKNMGDVVQILKSHLAGLTPVQQQQALTTMFGAYALSGMTVIASTTDAAWQKLTKSMSDTNAQDVAAEKINNVKGHMKILESTVLTLGMQMATFLLPTIDKIVGALTHFANWLQNLSPHAQHVILIVVGIVSALTVLAGIILTTAATIAFILPGLELLAPVFMAIGGAIDFMMGPWGLLIAAVVTGVVLLITHWKQVNDWLQEHFGVTIPGILHSLLTVFQTVWNAIKNVITSVWNYIKPTILNGIKELSTYWHSIWPELKQVFEAVWTVMKAIIGPLVMAVTVQITVALAVLKLAWDLVWTAMKSTLKLVWDAIVGIIKIAWDIISGEFRIALDLLTGHFGKAWTDMKDTANKIWGDIKHLFGSIVTDMENYGLNMVKSLGQGIMNGLHFVESAVSSVAGTIKSFLGFHSPTEEGPGSESDVWAPNFMKMYESGIEQNIPKLQSSLSVALQTPFNSMTNQLTTGNVSGRLGQTSLTGIGGSNSKTVQFNGPITIQTNAKDARGIANEFKKQFSVAL